MFGGILYLAPLAACGSGDAGRGGNSFRIIFRLRGAYFAIGTWVVAEVYRLTFAQISGVLGGGSRVQFTDSNHSKHRLNPQVWNNAIYWTALLLVITVLAGDLPDPSFAVGTGLGRRFRDSEAGAESVGVDNYRAKFLVYLLTAGATGSVRALIALQKLRISPDAAFSVNDWTAFVIFIVIIGGMGPDRKVRCWEQLSSLFCASFSRLGSLVPDALGDFCHRDDLSNSPKGSLVFWRIDLTSSSSR